MKQLDREAMVKALMHGVPRDILRVYRSLEGIADEDVDALEPVLDKIIAREVAAALAAHRTPRATSRVLQSSPRRERRGER